MVSQSNSHDSFSVGCIVAGFGFGAVTYCYETTIQHFVGVRKWPKIQSTLETLTGMFLAVFVICLSYLSPKDKNIQTWYVILGCVQISIFVVWLIIAIVMFIKTTMKKVQLGKRWHI